MTLNIVSKRVNLTLSIAVLGRELTIPEVKGLTRLWQFYAEHQSRWININEAFYPLNLHNIQLKEAIKKLWDTGFLERLGFQLGRGDGMHTLRYVQPDEN